MTTKMATIILLGPSRIYPSVSALNSILRARSKTLPARSTDEELADDLQYQNALTRKGWLVKETIDTTEVSPGDILTYMRLDDLVGSGQITVRVLLPKDREHYLDTDRWAAFIEDGLTEV